MGDKLRYEELYSLVKELLIAEKEAKRKRNKYFEAKSPSRARATTLNAKMQIANEWFGKCENSFEDYINSKIINGKFCLNYGDINEGRNLF